jgi:hypothetical protein
MNYGYTTIVGDFASPDWALFIRDLERAVANGRVAPNGAAAERERARRRIEQERASERLAWIATAGADRRGEGEADVSRAARGNVPLNHNTRG